MTLSVCRDAEGNEGMVNISVSDVLYMSHERKSGRIAVYTTQDKYYMTGTVKYWENVLNSSDYKFYLVDRGTLINVPNITAINVIYKVAFFGQDFSRKSSKCELAHHRFLNTVDELYSLNPAIQIVAPG